MIVLRLRKLASRVKDFKHFDEDQDGLLNKQELKAYSSSRGLDLPETSLDWIISSLKSISEETFRAAQRKLFVAHWEGIARRKAQEEEEKRRVVEEQKQVPFQLKDRHFSTESE